MVYAPLVTGDDAIGLITIGKQRGTLSRRTTSTSLARWQQA
jgi:hypothetical protein